MRCPNCGTETKAGQGCAKCGKDTGNSRRIAVEYKDFKVSELLDIRMSKKAVPAKEKDSPEVLAQKKNDDSEEEPALGIPSNRKNITTHVVAIIGVLAVAALIFLLRVLLKS
jgi:hypothetical protein